MKKRLLILILGLLCGHISADAQSTVRILNDSLTGNVSMRTTDGKLCLINWLGGDHYLIDTATGALSVFAHTDPVTSGTKTYAAQPNHLFSLNNRYPIWLNNSTQSAGSQVISIGLNGVVDTLFNYINSSSLRHFRADTLMWFTESNKLYYSNLRSRAVLADSGRTGSYLSTTVKVGHGGVYYVTQKGNGQQDSFILWHHNGTTRRRLAGTVNTTSILQAIGMYQGDFYFADIVGNTVATPNRNISIKKVSAAGVVTSLATLQTGAGVVDEYFAMGAGKIWFGVLGYNSASGRNMFSYTPLTNAFTQATAHSSTTVLPYLNNGSISPDSFLYYRVLGNRTKDTFYRTKGTPATTQRYGTTQAAGMLFLDSTDQDTYTSKQSFCGNYPIFHSYDTLWTGVDTGIANSGFGTTFRDLFIDWTKIGNTYYCMRSLGYVNNMMYYRIYKYSGCGIPQIQLGVSEPQLVFATAQTYPNPSRGAFQVRHEALNHQAKAQLFSMDGKLQSIQTATGVGVLEIQADRLPAGLYLLRVQQGNNQFTQRIEVL
ncbi:MAG: T9SS type A sorting domain-containing protein [Sphingobacteriales bacterium]|nr:MAG: T9SS type A sorting domain-containing protein [Sphingobacteriales bacterium]